MPNLLHLVQGILGKFIHFILLTKILKYEFILLLAKMKDERERKQDHLSEFCPIPRWYNTGFAVFRVFKIAMPATVAKTNFEFSLLPWRSLVESWRSWFFGFVSSSNVWLAWESWVTAWPAKKVQELEQIQALSLQNSF